MSIRQESPMICALGVKTLKGNTRLIGIPKERIQVVITLPDIFDFSEELYEKIEFFREKAECFIITSSSKEQCQTIIDTYKLRESLISTEFQDVANTFNIKDEKGRMKKSLMIVNTNCQLTHKDIL